MDPVKFLSSLLLFFICYGCNQPPLSLAPLYIGEYIDEIDQDGDGLIRTINLGSTGLLFRGEAKGDQAGFVVVNAGDVNGDGVDDILISAPYAKSQRGKVYLIYGGTRLELGNIDAEFIGENEGDHVGIYMAGAGDVNGDSCADILITARNYDNGTGKVYLIYGKGQLCFSRNELSGENDLSDTGLSLSGVTFLGVHENNYAGAGVASAGDIDGDGLADLLIGSYGADGSEVNSGRVYLIYGKALYNENCTNAGNRAQMDLVNIETSPDARCGHEINGEGARSMFGASLTGVGDVNQNGTNDILIGAYGFSPYEDGVPAYAKFQGKTYLFDVANFGKVVPRTWFASEDSIAYFGDFSPLDEVDDWRSCGGTLTKLGDVNGDDEDDFLIGCYAQDNPLIPEVDTGAAYLFFGGIDYTGEMVDDFGVIFIGAEDNGQLTQSNISGAGDVNRDGYSDILIGANRTNGKYFKSIEAGKTYLILGRPRDDFLEEFSDQSLDKFLDEVDLSFRDIVGFEFIGEEEFDESGFSVASGDFDGDGDSDILIGAPAQEINKNYINKVNGAVDAPRPGKVYLILSNY